MPTYEYACAACKHQFELEQRISEPPAKKCPKCGKLKAKRMISQGNFLLKGGGWYADGYGSSKKAGKAASPSASSTAPAASTSSSGSGTSTGGGEKKSGPKAAAE